MAEPVLGQSYKKLKSEKDLRLIIRCPGKYCKKVLGLVDKNCILHTESSRNWIKTEMEIGTVECKKCGNRVYWNRGNLKII